MEYNPTNSIHPKAAHAISVIVGYLSLTEVTAESFFQCNYPLPFAGKIYSISSELLKLTSWMRHQLTTY
jgi:hypothetical protein